MSNAPRPKAAVVTGATGGIGAAIAARLQVEGYAVYGTSRKVDAGRSRASGIDLRALDVRDDNAVGGLIDEVMRDARRIDVLVNNAGSMLAGAIEETSIAEAKDLFETNFFGA